MQRYVCEAFKAATTVQKWILAAGCALGLMVLGCNAAQAVTITFNTAAPTAATVIESAFKVTPTRIVNGRTKRKA
jgi:hypothetical protein